MISKTSSIGILGEKITETFLKNNGFKVRRADGDLHIGSTLVYDPNLTEFDCQNLFELTKVCWSKIVCGIPNRPCKNQNSDFFQFSPLDLNQFNKNPNLGGTQYNHYCSTHLQFAVRNGLCKTCKSDPCFIRTYLAINYYIRSYYSIIMLHLSNLKRYKHDSDYWKGYPGRIDYFAFKDQQYYCIEVKTNSSRLSRWQFIRLHWMKEYGFNSKIARVSTKTDDLNKSNIELVDFQISDYPEYLDDIPTKEELSYFSSNPIGWDRMKLRGKKKKLEE
jgi:hypothetical protein